VFSPLALHETDDLRLAHPPALVLFPGFGETGRKLQLDQLSANDGADIHAWDLACAARFDKSVFAVIAGLVVSGAVWNHATRLTPPASGLRGQESEVTHHGPSVSNCRSVK
jgi:hypothetical protein